MDTSRKFKYTTLVTAVLLLSSCSDFIDIDPPRTDLPRDLVFSSEETVTAAVMDIYYQLHYGGFASGDISSITFLGALSSDDAINRITFDPAYQQVNDNAILAENSTVLSLWTDMYSCIYKANAIMEGLSASNAISANLKGHVDGEARFIRAFCHFYLTNLWGDIPLITTTDYKINRNVGRTPAASVYEKIVEDLVQAKEQLVNDFSFSNGERTRVNKAAASALLSRVYLYLGDWENAEIESSLVIEDNNYSLTPLTEVFLKNSNEAILQLVPRTGNVWDRSTARSRAWLQPALLNAFEGNDQRRTVWITTDYRADKYKSGDNSFSEYSVILRLAEQYLIRAEARTQLNNFEGARNDLNAVRFRAGLPDTDADDIPSLMSVIEQERRSEFFLEWGHRWFDLKRWNRATAVLQPLKSEWTDFDSLYPIPERQIANDPAMRDSQNPGY